MMLALGNYLCRRRAGMNSTAKCRVPTRGFLPRSYIYRVSQKEIGNIDKNISMQSEERIKDTREMEIISGTTVRNLARNRKL